MLRHVLKGFVGGRLKRLFWFFWATLAAAILFIIYVYAPLPSASRSDKRLLEFGWDTPALQEMPQHIEAALKLPFDGLIMDINTPAHQLGLAWTIFGPQRVDQGQIEALANDFEGFEWGRLTDNFLRVNVYPATVDWFDDYTPILYNLEIVARLAYELGFAGIFVDTEMYRGVNLFDYREQIYRDQYTYSEYHQQAYQRGQEVMQALNHSFPGITVLYTYGMTLGSQAGSRDILAKHRYGLLIPFLEGMIATADDDTTFVDAFEGAYIYDQELQFLSAYKLIKGHTTYFYTRDAGLYGQKVRAGFGLWIDHRCNQAGLLPKGCVNGFTPESFKRARDLALRYSDKYVWIYSEGINWYTGAGIPQEWYDTLDLIP